MSPLRTLAIVCLFLSVVMTGAGGLVDMLNQPRDGIRISRQHMWNDGLYLAVVACALLLFDSK